VCFAPRMERRWREAWSTTKKSRILCAMDGTGIGVPACSGRSLRGLHPTGACLHHHAAQIWRSGRHAAGQRQLLGSAPADASCSSSGR
jgi:hypothetical protein